MQAGAHQQVELAEQTGPLQTSAVSTGSVVARRWRSSYSLNYGLEETSTRDRDAQFRSVTTFATQFLAAGDPEISVDTLYADIEHKEASDDFREPSR